MKQGTEKQQRKSMKATVGTSFARYMKEKEDMLLKSEMKMDRYWFFRNESIVRAYGE